MAPRDARDSWAEQTDGDDVSIAKESADPDSAPHGISILKEIFPDHASKPSPSKNVRSFSQFLNSVPSPARSSALPVQGVTSTVPLPAVPPPPQNTRDLNRMSPPMQPQLPTFPSYRERLRAGGREALQRTYESGLVPSAMRQNGFTQQAPCGHDPYRPQADMQNRSPTSSPLSRASTVDSRSMWNMNVESQPHGCAFFQQQDGQMNSQCSTPVSYTPSVESHPSWNMSRAVQSDDCWSASLDNYHQMPSPFFPAQQMHMVPQSHEMGHLAQLQLEPTTPIMQTMQPQMQQQMPMQMLPQTRNQDLPLPFPQMQVQPQQASLPHMQFQLSSSGEVTPSEFDRCMAIVMPDASRSASDRIMMAAQLQAAADCQCYED